MNVVEPTSNKRPGTAQLSAAKRALLEQYLRGERPAAATAGIIQDTAIPATAPHTGMVAVQAGQSRRPFFFLHGQWMLEKGSYCFPLAHGIGSDQPFYMLEPHALDNLHDLPALEAIAATHIASLRAVQPEGPYLLGGRCNGGLVAYEMARQLHAAGEQVDLLVLLDPMMLAQPAHVRLAHRLVKGCGRLTRLGRHQQVACFVGLRNAYLYLHDVGEYLRHHAARAIALLRLHGAQHAENGFAGGPAPTFPRLSSIIPTAEGLPRDYPGLFTWIALNYAPSTLYPGTTTFLWPSIDPFRGGWRAVEKDQKAHVHVIAGDAVSLITTHLPIVAAHLRACLDRAHGDRAAANGETAAGPTARAAQH